MLVQSWKLSQSPSVGEELETFGRGEEKMIGKVGRRRRRASGRFFCLRVNDKGSMAWNGVLETEH